MLEVGNGGMTLEEEKIHFGLWCLSKAPLLIGCDITNLSKETFEILTNPEIIAINQDLLGIQGRKIETIQPIPEGLYTKVSRVGTSAQNVLEGFRVRGLSGRQTLEQIRDLFCCPSFG